MKLKIDRRHYVQALLLAVLAAGMISGIVVYAVMRNTPSNTSNPSVTQEIIAPSPDKTTTSAVDANVNDQNSLLVYLIEEEKLAHDVYSKMYELYGSKVFGNIVNSEEDHQSKVLTLLNTRAIADPRSSKVGVFTNTELQTLYNQLVSQGGLSAEDAYKVGVAIEEKDIADITKQLATATDIDVVTTLENLRAASENHLRAFNRQLGKY